MIDAEILRAAELLAAGRAAEADALTRAALQRDPASVEARCVLATIALRQGVAMTAGPWLRQASALKPSYPQTHYYLALFRLERGDVPGTQASQARARHLLPSGSKMADSLEAFIESWDWLDTARPSPLPAASSFVGQERDTPSWLFVWRDLGEFLQHFDHADAGVRQTLLLPRRVNNSSEGDPTDRLLRQAGETVPDVVVFLPGTSQYRNPRLEAFQELRSRGIPTVLVVPDLRKAFWQGIILRIEPVFDLVVSLDGCSLESLPPLRHLGRRFFRGWSPISLGAVPPFADRPSMVNLVGSLWGDRIAGVDALRGAGIEVVTRPKSPSGPQDAGVASHKTLTTAAYLDSLRQARLTVNFSACSTGDGHQLKGRVFEAAACGSMILESANDMTRDYFEEGRDFITFESIPDLVDKARYFLDHPAEAAEIAANATRRFRERYTARHFWREVLARARANRRGQS